jgi:hypothetical protein
LFRRIGPPGGLCAGLAWSGAEDSDLRRRGTDPVWSHDGKELFYRNGTKMMAVAVTTAPVFSAGKPQMLWSGNYTLSSSCGIKGVTTTSYDVPRDGQRFLMIKDRDSKLYATKVRVVLNWVEELSKIVADANASR